MLGLLLKHSKLIIIWGIIFAALALGVSLVFPRFYSAESQVLIISRDKSGLDPFTQTKLAEQVGENLTQVLQTEDFFTKVIEQGGTNFDRTRWTNREPRVVRKQWHRDVGAEMVYGTSLLRLTAYGPTPVEATNLSTAITQTLVSHAWEYMGGDLSLKIVNTPLASRWPTRPNFLLNVVGGFVVGAVLVSVWLVRYKRHALWS